MKHLVTLFKTTKSVNTGYNRDVSKVFQRIKEGASQRPIEKIRKTKNKEQRDALKLELLPVICFNGTFRYRSEAGFIAHSGLCILDFDKIPTDQMQAHKDSLSACEYIFACWLSPSGFGFKALVQIPPEPEKHKGYFNEIAKFFDSPYLDTAGNYVASPCYESYDPDIYINPEASLWSKCEIEEIEDIGVTTADFPVTSENRIITNLLEWWKKKFGKVKGERNANVFKLAKAFNDFGIHKQEAEQVLLTFREKDFNEHEIRNIVKSAYKDKAAFRSKFFEDHEIKRRIEKMIRSGKKVKDIVAAMPEADKEMIERGIETIKETIAIDDFWEYDENGKIKLIPHKYKFWLQQHNFFKYYPSKKSEIYTFILKDQNLLEETDKNRIKDFVLTHLMNRTDIGFYPYDYMASNQKFFTFDYLSFLDSADVEIKRDNKEECYIYFKNCAVKVTNESINKVDYIDVDGFVWRNQIIDDEFEILDHHDSEFRRFIWLISAEDVDRYNTMKSVIGYLLHSFQNSANNKAIILNDELISEHPNGGSGKGIFWRALRKMKRVSRIDGKLYDPSKTFSYQTVTVDSQIVVFDDVKKNFNFENLFSAITEGYQIEYKNQGAVQLPISESPKTLIATNYTIGGIGGSFARRKFEVEFSNHFNDQYTPEQEFGHMLIDDWNETEMNRFYSFMIQCVQYYLKHGLKTYEHKNLEKRKFIKSTSHEFFEWANEENIPFDVRLDRKVLYNQFIEEYSDLKKWLKQKTFTGWLKTYVSYTGLEYLDGKSNGVWWMVVKSSPDASLKTTTPGEISFDGDDKDKLPF